MNTSTRNILAAVFIVGAIAIYGAYLYPQPTEPQAQLAGTSAAGSTFSTAKIAAVVMTPSDTTGTTTSLLNTDANTRYVTGNFVDCSNATTSYTAFTGAGLANWNIKAGTTSNQFASSSASTPFYLMNTNVATGTSVAGGAPFTGGLTMVASSSFSASSTNSLSAQNALYGNIGATSWQYTWPSSTYLTFWSNATNTAACTVGVSYISS